MAKKWIQAMHMKKGALRATAKAKPGKNIPSKKLASLAKKGGTTGRRALLAMTLKKLHK